MSKIISNNILQLSNMWVDTHITEHFNPIKVTSEDMIHLILFVKILIHPKGAVISSDHLGYSSRCEVL